MTRSTRAVGAAGLVAATAWMVSGAISARHGLDLTDEGFYLVTYRWWDSYEASFTGTQYLFGPLFEALGYRIDRLRLARLLLHVLASGYFAIALVSWVHTRTSVTWSRDDRGLLALAVFSAGSSAYAWLPLSPGYNDVTVATALVLSAAVCHTAASSRLATPGIAAAGAVLASALVAKWSVVVMGALFLAVVLCLRARQGSRQALTALGALGGGALLALGLVHLVTPLPDLVTAIGSSSARLAAGTNSPGDLVVKYLAGALLPAALAVVIGGFVSCLWVVATRRGRRWVLAALVTAVVAVPALTYVATGQFPLGGRPLLPLVVALWAFFVFGVSSALLLLGRPPQLGAPRVGDAALVVVWLLAAPWVHGLGTGNDLYLLAISCVAPWIGVLVYLWARLRAASMRPAADVVVGALVGAVLLTAWGAVTANLVLPYRSDPVWRTSVPADAIPALTGLHLAEEDIRAFAELQRSVPADSPATILVLDEVPGLSLVLGIPPLAEAWTSAADPERTWAGVEEVCREDPSRPLIVLTRSVRRGDLKALRECEIDFYADYRPVRYDHSSLEVAIYVPRNR